MAGQIELQRPRLDALAVGLMVLLCTLWGVQQVASKVALTQGIPPFLQAVLRSVVAGPLLVGWLFARRGRRGVAGLFHADGSLWPGLSTGLLFAAEFMLLFSGVRLTSASHAVVLLFTGGLFTAAGTHLFVPGERLRPTQGAGLVLAFVGAVVTAGKGGGGSTLLGDMLVLGAAACWGFTTVVVKASPKLLRISAEKVLAYQIWGAFPLLVIAAWMAGEIGVPVATPLAWASLLYQGVVIAFASYLGWYWLVRRYPAGRLAAFSFLTPILGILAAALFLGDPLTLSLLAGLVLVCSGLILVNR